MNFKIISILHLILILMLLSGCKKLVEVEAPPTSLSSKNVYDNDATAIGSITSLYVNLSNASLIGPGELTSLSCIGGLSADELTYNNNAGNGTLEAYYHNNLSTQDAGGGDYWSVTYQRLYVVNSALEGLQSSNRLTPLVKQQLLGEVKFMRAFYYFYLTNLYGDVPLVLSTDYKVNSLIGKSSKAKVYDQIVSDLNESYDLLSDRYLKADVLTPYSIGSEERVRPTKWAAAALLARVYLFMGEWMKAEIQASVSITNAGQFQIEPLEKVFLKNNREAIWQLQPTTIGGNTADADIFFLPPEGPSGNYPVYLSNEFTEDYEVGDQRKQNWIGSLIVNDKTYYYPFKYKIRRSNSNAEPTEYSTVMRLAEQFLIRAESRAHLDNLKGAITDVDQIRKRAGLTLISEINPNIDKEGLINLILKEKRREFFTEWGHRWLDLKRTHKIEEIMTKITPLKSGGGSWKSHQQYYPIWLYELQANPNLTQNSGY